MDKNDGNPFWQFSLALYGRPAVADACLTLQEDAEVDVNLLLFVLWRASRGVLLDEQAVRAIAEETKSWREEVVRPLRQVRRWLKDSAAPGRLPGAEKVRSSVKRIELEAEYWQQIALFDLASRLPSAPSPRADSVTLAQDNLSAYQRVLGVGFPEGAVRAVLDGFAENQAAAVGDAAGKRT